MAKKEQRKIKCISYVHVGDKLVETSQLNPEQKERLASWLKVTYLNNLYAGKAVFWAEGETPPPAADPGGLDYAAYEKNYENVYDDVHLPAASGQV